MMKKRIISLLLTVAMFISVLPLIASADAVDNEPSLKSVSMTLDGILSLNVMVNPGSVSDMSGYKVKFTIGESAPWECTQPDYDEGTNLYEYTAKITAHKLQKSVKIELLDAENAIVDESSWTLDAYLAYIVGRDSGLSELADALDLYSKNAAAYATNSAGTAPATAVEQATLLDHKCEVVTTGEIIPSAVLLLNDACTLRVQISADKWANGYSLKIGGEAKELEYDETKGIYYYDIKDIRAQDWGTKYAVEIVDSSNATLYKVNYAVMSYIYTVLGQPDNYAKEINLLKSMYLYFQGADNYLKAEKFNYSLTYDANYEGSDETKVVSATNITATSKNFTVADNTFVRPGYKFTDWNTKADGTGTSYAVGGTVSLVGSNTLFSENLGELAAIPDGWVYRDDGAVQADKSVWSASNGVLKSTGTSGKNQVLLVDAAINEDNYEITANVVMQATGSIGLVFANNHYFRLNCSNATNNTYLLSAGYTTENFKSLRTTCAANEQLGSGYGLVVGEVATFKVVVEGTKFTVYINGQVACTEDTSARTGDTHGAYAMSNLYGKVGLLQMNASGDAFGFKDIKVWNSKTAETLYAQWEELPLINMNLGELATNPEGWRHINNGYYVTTNNEHDTSAWSAADGVMKCSITSNNQVLMLGTTDAENYVITVNVVMQSERGGSIGLAFGDNHYFRIWLNGSGYWRLYAGDTSNMYASSPQNGVIHEMAPVTGVKLKVGESATLKVKVEGSNFTIYVNDVVWASATASKNLTGRFGLFQRGNLGTGGFKDILAVKTEAANG